MIMGSDLTLDSQSFVNNGSCCRAIRTKPVSNSDSMLHHIPFTFRPQQCYRLKLTSAAITKILFIVLLLQNCQPSKALRINPQRGDSNITYCLGSNEPLELMNPFDPTIAKTLEFIAMSWFMDLYNADGTMQEIPLLFYSNTVEVKDNRVSLFDFWGIQFPTVRVSDTSVLRAVLRTSTSLTQVKIGLVVAETPKLESTKLDLTRRQNDDGTVTLSCGKIASLGEPPIELQLKTKNGDILKTSFINGFFSATLTGDEDVGDYSCDVKKSPAMECISEQDQPAWEGSVLLASSTSAAGMTGILIGAIVGGVVLIIIIVTIVALCLRRKKSGKAYNTKGEEAQMEAPHQESERPFLNEDKNKTPIYKGANPYAVSGIKLPSHNASTPSYDSSDRDRAVHSSGNADRDRADHSSGDVKKPRAKPRSIFLTASMEALDQLGKDDGSNMKAGTAV